MRLCSVPGCNEKHHAKGYCQKHYQQSRTHKSILPERADQAYTNRPMNSNHSHISRKNTSVLDHCLLELKDMLERLDRLN